jgi:ornithine cyclodeaminase/alanine dehydrogenase-like protein (mu-crystallin family)
VSSLPYIDASDLVRLVGLDDAISAVETMFAESATTVPQRSHISVANGDLLLMPATSDMATGVKLVTVNPGNPPRDLPLIHGLYVLFSADTLAPVCLIDGAALTSLRTPAVSAVATRFLAREDSNHLVLFGSGTQARGHLHAMMAVRPIASVVVVSPSGGTELVEHARSVGLDASAGPPEAVADADIVCTCTTSDEPVFEGALLSPGVHVNAIGAYKPRARELDDDAIGDALIVVENKRAAIAEAGDLLMPLRAGVIVEEDIVAELPELVAGKEVRTGDEDITIFKSVGLASEDLAVAAVAFAARDREAS